MQVLQICDLLIQPTYNDFLLFQLFLKCGVEIIMLLQSQFNFFGIEIFDLELAFLVVELSLEEGKLFGLAG